jgi:hypothetical protein
MPTYMSLWENSFGPENMTEEQSKIATKAKII